MKLCLPSIQFDRVRAASASIPLGLLLTCAAGGSAFGADRHWIGTAFEDTWSAQANWSPSGPSQDGDTLIFGNNASHKNNRNDLQNLRIRSAVFTFGTALVLTRFDAEESMEFSDIENIGVLKNAVCIETVGD